MSARVLGGGDALPEGLWELWYWAGPGLTDGFYTRMVHHPVGELVWPSAFVESLAMAPLVSLAGPVVGWNVLWVLRAVAAAAGTALILRSLGRPLGWAGLVLLAPALWWGAEGGHLGWGAVAWAPLAAWALSGRGVRLALAVPLLAAGPAAWLGGVALALGVWGGALGGVLRSALAAALAAGLLVTVAVLSAWDGTALWGPWGPALGGEITRSVVHWLPVLALLGLARSGARRGAAIAIVGGLIAVVLPSGALVSWVGLAIVAASLMPRGWPLAAGLLFALPQVTAVRTAPLSVAEGPVLTYPLETGQRWSLYAQTQHESATSGGLRHLGPADYVGLIRRHGWRVSQLQRWAIANGFVHLVVDVEATAGKPTDVALSLGGAVNEVSGQPWRGGKMTGHDAGKRVVITVDPSTFDADPHPDDWTWVHPDLAYLLDVDEARTAPVQVTLYVSDDARDWQPLGDPIAHSVSSLGLDVVDDEALVITSMPPPPSPHEDGAQARRAVSAIAFTTTDLETWGVRRYTLDASAKLVDPELRWEEGRPVLYAWIQEPIVLGGSDPAFAPGPHVVIRAPQAESGLMVISERLHDAPRLADPLPVEDLLYYTRINLSPRITTWVVVARRNGDVFEVVHEIEGLSVPFVLRETDGWRMLAHGTSNNTEARPVMLTSENGIDWSEPVALEGRLAGVPCESPVMAWFKGRYVLACSVRAASRATDTYRKSPGHR